MTPGVPGMKSAPEDFITGELFVSSSLEDKCTRNTTISFAQIVEFQDFPCRFSTVRNVYLKKNLVKRTFLRNFATLRVRFTHIQEPT